jgi:hypothetical protein
LRKAFNFYHSYFTVFKELSDKDKLAFITALLEKQFEGKEPNLKGQAKFAYLSQKHSIDSQVLGYETKTKEKLTPTEGGRQWGIVGASVQGKGKEKEEVEIPKVSKHFFTKDALYNKVNFKDAFPDWSKEKLAYYYEQVLTWSNEGNMKKDWKATVRTWALRDEKQGKIKFNVVTSSSQHDGIL